MSDAKLYSIAAIARKLDAPESTLHAWKNRFDEFLPCVGSGRNRRFRADAIPVFIAIQNLLGAGLSTNDIKSELSKSFPRTIETDQSPASQVSVMSQSSVDAPGVDSHLTAAIGAEIARAIGENLSRYFSQPAPLPDETVQHLKAQAEEQQHTLCSLQDENKALVDKLHALENELVRLRKDRREMEKYLLGKINTAQKK
ncbi:MerR family transcriptional regulator [Desulfovibrio inopinatus]|uniref:MerR family transcriptional regulator n=1 Tax=Desulfovibrio inopinatus TaxID=102109 RepID=UPI0003F9D7A1|nr:MerR family transcriptional regulator [Desulfovibrio inopinatus]